MEIEKRNTETYVLTNLEGLDPVTVYVTNYEPGKGKIVIECYGESWANYWGGMRDMDLQHFFCSCDNDYILRKFLSKTHQTDFDKIMEIAKETGFDICATNDVELAMQQGQLEECFGPNWYMDLPQCTTREYQYLNRIVDTVKNAFSV